MTRRIYSRYQDSASKGWFLFAHHQVDQPKLHIWIRHQVTPEIAVETFSQGLTTWNSERLRFETETETHMLFWAWHQPSGDVLVISCFRKDEI